MISGFGGPTRAIRPHNHESGGGNLPIPFNIPKVLYNLLFEDIGLEFDPKQQDLIEMLRFSYKALPRMEANFIKKDQELRHSYMEHSNSLQYKERLEELQLDRLQGVADFKDFVTVVSEVLTREQYTKLLEYSGIPT